MTDIEAIYDAKLAERLIGERVIIAKQFEEQIAAVRCADTPAERLGPHSP